MNYAGFTFLIIYGAFISYGLYRSFRPITIPQSTYIKHKQYNFWFCLLAAILLPVIMGLFGKIYIYFGLTKTMPQSVTALIILPLILLYWIALGSIIVRRNLRLISTLLTVSFIFIITMYCSAYLIGRITIDYLIITPILVIVFSVCSAASSWFGEKYAVKVNDKNGVRRFSRVRISLEVGFQQSYGPLVKASSLDISEGGIRLLLPEELLKGEVMDLEINFPHPPIIAQGEVVWTKEKKIKEGKFFQAGIKFINMKPTDREGIHAFVHDILTMRERRKEQGTLSVALLYL